MHGAGADPSSSEPESAPGPWPSGAGAGHKSGGSATLLPVIWVTAGYSRVKSRIRPNTGCQEKAGLSRLLKESISSKTCASLIVLYFTISAFKSLFSCPFSLLCFRFLLRDWHYQGRMGCRKINSERKKERMRLKKRCVHELPISEMVNSGTVRLKEDISFEKRRHPRRRQLRRLFPVCITILWVLGSYTDRQLLQ